MINLRGLNFYDLKFGEVYLLESSMGYSSGLQIYGLLCDAQVNMAGSVSRRHQHVYGRLSARYEDVQLLFATQYGTRKEANIVEIQEKLTCSEAYARACAKEQWDLMRACPEYENSLCYPPGMEVFCSWRQSNLTIARCTYPDHRVIDLLPPSAFVWEQFIKKRCEALDNNEAVPLWHRSIVNQHRHPFECDRLGSLSDWLAYCAEPAFRQDITNTTEQFRNQFHSYYSSDHWADRNILLPTATMPQYQDPSIPSVFVSQIARMGNQFRELRH